MLNRVLPPQCAMFDSHWGGWLSGMDVCRAVVHVQCHVPWPALTAQLLHDPPKKEDSVAAQAIR